MRQLTAKGLEHVRSQVNPKPRPSSALAEMARMVGLVAGRFYQLIGTTFPWPSIRRGNTPPIL